jgi:3-phosphoshikimate 1-carboxyvinyltransferase
MGQVEIMLDIKLPYSKSELIRLMILGSQLTEPVTLRGSSQAEDVFTLQNALSVLGCEFEIYADRIILTPPQAGRLHKKCGFEIGNSAAGFRMMLALLAAQPEGEYLLSASQQLQIRPMQPLVTALQQMGATIDTESFPYKIKGAYLNGSNVTIDTSLSSQFLSALLLIAPQYPRGLNIEVTGSRVSWKYVAMTISVLNKMGMEVEENGNMLSIAAGSRLSNPEKLNVEPDYSCACYFWAMAAIYDKSVKITGNRSASHQSDAGFVELLAKMGATVIDNSSFTSVKGSNPKGIKVDMSQMPDQVPTLAVMGLLATSKMEIYNISHLQYKESNRIVALVQEIRRCGGRADYLDDCLTVHPLSKVHEPVLVDSHGDHRLAMAFAMLTLKYPEVKIADQQVVNKSFPGFWQEFKRFRDSE